MTISENVRSEIAQGVATSKEGKYLTFVLGAEQYGLPVLKVKEIIGVLPFVAIPQMPDYVNGVINLRDKVIPVIDLRRKFSMQSIDYTDRTCIIVVEVDTETRKLLMGVVVDAVADVRQVKNENIEPPPSFSGEVEAKYILGMAKMEGKVTILLDMDRVLRGRELIDLERGADANLDSPAT